MNDTVSSGELYRAIVHGAVSARDRRDELNRINVFPVVDNDTGTNVAHTMRHILRHALPDESISRTLGAVARSALVGARGNSGAIFSQYFNGLYRASPDRNAVSVHELADLFHAAFDRAYRAIEEPIEGTVITLMRAWAVSFRESIENRRPIHELFEHSLARIKTALAETTALLEVLRKNRVVDAGALGFYYFMEGFVNALLGKVDVVHTSEASAVLPAIPDAHGHTESEEEIRFRYCTEVLLESDGLDEEGLRARLRPLGDCLLVSSADTLARIHLHTNEPWELVRIAGEFGRILENKADDMIVQNRLAAGVTLGAAALVTDSIADIPREFLFDHGVYQVPLNIMIDGTSFLDKLTVDGEFLAAQPGPASTAQLSADQIHSLLRPLLARYERVLVLTVSKHMSGTYARFREALADVGPDADRVALVDTMVNSGAQGLLVREAVRMIEAGESFDEIVRSIEALRARARILVSVQDIEPMARSGRVSEKIGDLLIRLKFKPLVSIDREGKGTIKGVAFSEKRNWKILLKSLSRVRPAVYAIVHAGAPERAEALRAELSRVYGMEPAFITEISAAVTLFAGRGSVAAAYLEAEKKR